MSLIMDEDSTTEGNGRVLNEEVTSKDFLKGVGDDGGKVLWIKCIEH